MRVFPNTTTKGPGRHWPLYLLVAAALVALSLGVETFLRAENFSPREEIVSPSIQNISVSAQNSLYPPPDTGHFTERPETIFVYLSVDGLPSGEDMEARVQRAGSGSVFSILFGQGVGLEALDEQEDQLSSTENGATGVVKFALKTKSGEPMPPGNYTIDIYGPGSIDASVDEEAGAVAARKFFVVEG